MRRVYVFVCAVAVLLTVEVDARGNSGVINAVKQNSSALVHRWQQRVAPRIQARWEQARLKTLLLTQRISVSPAAQQTVIAITLCTLLGCAGVTHSPENTATGEAVAQQAPAETPDTKKDEAEIIITKLFGQGFVAARGLTYDSIAAYKNNKAELPLEFYDGMMVHYVKDGLDYVRIVDLIGNSTLKVRYVNRDVLEVVELATIEGAMIGEHPDYGTRLISVEAQFLRNLNNGGGQQLLDEIPKETVFYGMPNRIFSDGDYVVNLFAFSPAEESKIFGLPEVVRFVASNEHLVTITDPEVMKQIPPPQQKPQFKNRPRQQRSRAQEVVALIE